MPILRHGAINIDYAAAGVGQPVVLIHSSVSGNRQWRSLTAALVKAYHVRALNLFGYGATTPWPAGTPQSLAAQAALVVAVCKDLEAPIHLVGHSLGGAVALKAAQRLGPQVGCLVLLEPNLFNILRQHRRVEAYAEADDLRRHVQTHGARGEWAAAAARFADYWLGDGAWDAMPEARRAAFTRSLPPVAHEWEAVMNEALPLADLRAVTAQTLVVSDVATRRPIREIVDLLAWACPHWTFRDVAAGGHMAPLTRPDVINPIVRAFLDEMSGRLVRAYPAAASGSGLLSGA